MSSWTWLICRALNFALGSVLSNSRVIEFYFWVLYNNRLLLFSLGLIPFRSAHCGPRDQGVKFSARLLENAASLCPLDPLLHPPTPPPPPRQVPLPSRPGANSLSACTLLPVSFPIHAWSCKSSLSALHIYLEMHLCHLKLLLKFILDLEENMLARPYNFHCYVTHLMAIFKIPAYEF